MRVQRNFSPLPGWRLKPPQRRGTVTVAIVTTFGPAEFDRDVANLDITAFHQPLAERSHQMRIRRR